MKIIFFQILTSSFFNLYEHNISQTLLAKRKREGVRGKNTIEILVDFLIEK